MDQTHYRQSIDAPETFWKTQAARIDWHTFPTRILDAADVRRPGWFVGGKTNLCHNAVDRHLARRAEQAALVHVCVDAGVTSTFTYAQLHEEVNLMAAVLLAHGVGVGDRVLLSMPSMPEAVFAMLACARIGAVHCMVFAGFPAPALASRIDDVAPVLIMTAGSTGASRGGADTSLQTVRHALARTRRQPRAVIHVERHGARADPEKHVMANDGCVMDGLPGVSSASGALVQSYGALRARLIAERSANQSASQSVIPCAWLDSAAPSYILHTSGTTGAPKGIVRDTGGYAVALATSIDLQFGLRAGDTLFSTSDLGWVVGHSYGVYAPLIGGMTTVLYEGSPVRPGSDALWRVAARCKVNAMLSAPTVMRLLRREGLARARQHDLSRLRAVFLAGEPLDEASAERIERAIGKPVIDHYWQTETGSPIIAGGRLSNELPRPAAPVSGFRVDVIDEDTGERCRAGSRGVVCLAGPLPPGCVTRVWGDDDGRQLGRYWRMPTARHRHALYSTGDWGVADVDGHLRLLGRSDDVINVAGQRLGTREIEAVIRADARVADVAVMGVDDAMRGQVPVAFIVLAPDVEHGGPDGAGDVGRLDALKRAVHLSVTAHVSRMLGRQARPRDVVFVDDFPRTRSGKVMRRLMRGTESTPPTSPADATRLPADARKPGRTVTVC